MIELRAGDIFLLEGTRTIDRLINWFQRLWNGDHASTCSHCGILVSSTGDTFETTPWRTGFLNLFYDHSGSRMYIYRWHGMNYEHRWVGENAVADQYGKIYPYHRLLLFALHLARYIHWKGMVCSELVSCFLAGVGARERYWGINVDQLRDDCAADPKWDLVYYGRPRDYVRD